MSLLVKFIADIAPWLYLLLGLIILWQFRIMQLALRERSRSIFALERENAGARFTRAFINVMVVILMGLGIYYVSNSLIEQVPLPVATPTPTEVVALPPTPTQPQLLPTPTPTSTPTPRPTTAAQVEITPTPEATTANAAGTPPNCPVAGASISRPGNGAIINGGTQIYGSAAIEGFDYYKIEFRVPNAPSWSFIQDFRSPVPNGFLAAWNTGGLPVGEYELRLVVVNKTGNYPEPCVVRVRVQ